ncbi:MAG: SDR family NAD(P)-dependent oxidoreductase [Actinomycetota bacterium]|nr:SDR family NAD(P)-dependent oxidoreductase [Actinomycetota bacterium]
MSFHSHRRSSAAVGETLDRLMDRSIVLGYGAPGLLLRRRLPGWPADPPRMAGRTVLVTGAASGIGLATAAGYARLGASVRVLGRDGARAEEAVSRTTRRVPGADVRPVVCDVSSVESLHAFADRFLAEEPRLDVLVNNAGVMPDERKHSVDGVELTYATHVLAPWVLTDRLAGLLRAGAPGRVVNVTSGGQYARRVPPGDVESAGDRYSPKKVYARTKRAQMIVTDQWADRLRDRDVVVHAMHPGWADTKGVRNWLPVFRVLTRSIIRTPEQGADTAVWLGGAPRPATCTGLLWHDRMPRPLTYRAGAGPDPEHVRAQVWRRAETLAHGRHQV